MDTHKQNSSLFFKSIKIIFFALLAGQLFFAFVAFFIINFINGGFIKDIEINEFKYYIILLVAFLAISAFSAGRFVFKNRLNAIKNITTLPEKIMAYRSVLIMQYAIIEGASFLSIVAFMLTGFMLLLGIAAILIIYFGTLIPSVTRTIKNLELNPGDEQKLNDPNFLI